MLAPTVNGYLRHLQQRTAVGETGPSRGRGGDELVGGAFIAAELLFFASGLEAVC